MNYIFAPVTLLLAVGACSAKPYDDEPISLALAGAKLNAAQVADLEATLVNRPDDLAAHTKLLGYYAGAQFKLPDAQVALRRQVLWFIKNYPEGKVVASGFCSIHAISDPDGYNAAKQLWSDQIKAHPKSAAILGNAAKFLFLTDRTKAEELLKQAKSLDDKNPTWPDQLGHLYALRQTREAAAKALAEYELAQSIDDIEISRFRRIDELAKSAYNAGEMEKASQYAQRSLQLSAKFKESNGNAIHCSNNLLGRIALKKGDAAGAKEYLLKAGQSTGSPNLDSFGPNMSLAMELLEAGEKDAVLQYFSLCRKFWKLGGPRLDEWTNQVKAGQTPQFGANLFY